ncbi:MAG: acyclic terpene utilization AtuA family protein [Deltaproteobacteria bacterium]|jgi:hypothetical protein|nr:acyclic terpene utilization AtuA family protein [Deltaproteobacteria bacterium]MBW2531168.1 acyclic terpene utilization AtuA family protein [Deltaproteobacteria bacterium]
MTTVRIGCASGFWGDSQIAAHQLVERGRIDYLVLDYLAEVTMGLLARAGSVSADGGYATDFVTSVMAPLLADLRGRGIRVVTNAGGVNPAACRDALERVAERSGVPLRIAVVEGDDLLERMAELPGLRLDAESAPPDAEQLLSLNAYLGAVPIAAALDREADVVITGRSVDSALVLGPLVHEHRWPWHDFDRLAAGSLAGHVVECGAQATGGLFTDWTEVPRWEEIGYPIVECEADGTFVVTKPPRTGGLVTPATVAEQIVYEIGDPAAYLLPDVICDFSRVELRADGSERVRVGGAQGRPPSGRYKVTATAYDGYRTSALAMLYGDDAVAKAERVADAMLTRVRGMLAAQGLEDFRQTRVEVLGSEHVYGPHGRRRDTREVVLRLSVHHDRRKAVSLFAKEVASAGTSFAPGLSGMIGGRARPTPMLKLYDGLIDERDVPVTVVIGSERSLITRPKGVAAPLGSAEPVDTGSADPSRPGAGDDSDRPSPEHRVRPGTGERVAVRLFALAHGRSGDKGNDANVGIIARRPEYLPLLQEQLTPARVARFLAHLIEGGAQGRVERYEWPGLGALNFVLRGALGGGGLSSLRYDAQGKGLAQLLLELAVSVPKGWIEPLGPLPREEIVPATSS